MSLSASGKKRSPATIVAVVSVALSVGVMLAAVSVVRGFKREIRDKIVGINAHLTLQAIPDSESDDNPLVRLSPQMKGLLDTVPYIRNYYLEGSVPGVIKTRDDFKGVYVKGSIGKGAEEFLKKNLVEGNIPDFSSEDGNDKIVVTSSIASQLGLKIGDSVPFYFFSDAVRVRPMKVAGIINTNFESYDNNTAFSSLGLLQDIVGLDPEEGIVLRIITDDFELIPHYESDLQSRLISAKEKSAIDRNYEVIDVLSQGATYFSWLNLLDMNVAIILTLMGIVAVTTLISAMLIVILDKIRIIGLLKALGASNNMIRHVFVLLAMRICLSGLLIGNVLILILLYVQDRTHLLHLDPESYYIDFVPVDFDPGIFIAVNIAVVAVVWLTLLLPSRFVADISPSITAQYD